MAKLRMIDVFLKLKKMVTASLNDWAPYFVIGIMLAISPSYAQVPPLNDATIDPEIDPDPYDPRREIRKLLMSRMPTQWWMNEPEGTLNTFHVLIHAPVEWRGNPVSAVMSMCPEHNDPLWSALSTLELQPFYQNRRWPSVICRP